MNNYIRVKVIAVLILACSVGLLIANKINNRFTIIEARLEATQEYTTDRIGDLAVGYEHIKIACDVAGERTDELWTEVFGGDYGN